MNDQSNLIQEALAYLDSEEYEAAIAKAQTVLNLDINSLDRGACEFVIGCSLRELGKPEKTVPHLLEAISWLTDSNSIVLTGQAYEELARTLFILEKINAAVFFLDLAIANYELAKENQLLTSTEILDSARALHKHLFYL